MRPSGRKYNQIRDLTIETGVLLNRPASCVIKLGNTHVICSATVDNHVPRFIKGQGYGWITAEYGMLPNATNERTNREASSGKVTGRTMEIQRLIGRSLRTAVDLPALGERQIIVDCDVINADGGTRTAAITGGYVALHLALRQLVSDRVIRANPLKLQVAAISCGIYNDNVVVDLDYAEDSKADVDANFIFASNGEMIEVQTTGEKSTFNAEHLMHMVSLSQAAAEKLFGVQNKVLLEL